MAKKILVVEDNELNRKLFVSVLRKKGYGVSEAADGEEALARIKIDSPSLILMDILLPEASGIEVLKTCKDKGLLYNAKVYALTASMTPEISEAGFDGIIPKPVKISDFLETVEKTLEVETGKEEESD